MISQADDSVVFAMSCAIRHACPSSSASAVRVYIPQLWCFHIHILSVAHIMRGVPS